MEFSPAWDIERIMAGEKEVEALKIMVISILFLFFQRPHLSVHLLVRRGAGRADGGRGGPPNWCVLPSSKYDFLPNVQFEIRISSK